MPELLPGAFEGKMFLPCWPGGGWVEVGKAALSGEALSDEVVSLCKAAPN